MKAIALAVSARQHGNCYDFAQFTLNRLSAQGIETELVNFFDYQITPCRGCAYECLNHLNPRGMSAQDTCPIQDDVRAIWEKTWNSEILLLFVPTYGGMPPALWLAFSQRQQAFFRQAPLERLKKSVVSAVVLSSPHQSSGSSWIPSFMSDEVKGMDRKVAGFEVITQTEFGVDYLFNPLIRLPEIQRRLEFMTDRTLKAAQEAVSQSGT
jgi:multimeric flavodoxin WrbA